jgi:hypothetical protein
MKTITFWVFITSVILPQVELAQGFINLNFESANLSAYGAGPAIIPTTNGIPGWTAYIGGSPQTSIVYNTVSTGAASVDLEGTNNDVGYPPIQGKYFVLLQGVTGELPTTASLGQTGQVPSDAMSLIYWGSVGIGNISFDGNVLPVTQTGTVGSYGIYEADIAPYAGQTGQLLFTANPNQFFFLDNIQFSPSPVPEPTALGLSVLGGLLLAWRRWKIRCSDPAQRCQPMTRAGGSG